MRSIRYHYSMNLNKFTHCQVQIYQYMLCLISILSYHQLNVSQNFMHNCIQYYTKNINYVVPSNQACIKIKLKYKTSIFFKSFQFQKYNLNIFIRFFYDNFTIYNTVVEYVNSESFVFISKDYIP